MMFETLILLAAAAGAAQPAPQANGCEQAAVDAAPAINPAIIEMTDNAFVAVEETPAVRELVRPAVGAMRVKRPAFVVRPGTAWIS